MIKRIKLPRCFTLIELLVVIAIIAILMAILLPGLKAAKAKGTEIACNNLMGQLAIATKMYISDNAGVYPVFYIEVGVYDRPEYFWFNNLADYSGGSRNNNNIDNEFRICPQEKTYIGVNYIAVNNSSTGDYKAVFAYGRYSSEAPGYYHPPILERKVENPDHFYLMQDSKASMIYARCNS